MSPTRSTSGAFAPGKREATLLVVDDEEMNRDLLSRRLRWAGYTTLTASSGPEALVLLEGERIDLVLLDIMMPGMNGYQVLEEIRRTRSPTELPVIMATAKSETDDIVDALRGGANDYVIKPLNFPVVLARVQTQVDLKLAMRALASSEARYRQLAEHSADLIMLHAPDGTIRYASPASRVLLGYAPEELVGHSLWEFMHKRDRRAIPRAHEQLPDVYTLIVRLRRVDTSYLWVEMVSRTSRDELSGKVHEIQTTTRDISAYVDRACGDRPPAAGGKDFIDTMGWREPIVQTSSPDEPLVPQEVVDLLDAGPTIIAHEDESVRASLEAAIRRRPRLGRPAAL